MPRDHSAMSLRRRFGIALLIIYAPYSWLLFPHGTANEYWDLLKLLPVLPYFAIHGLTGCLPDSWKVLHSWEVAFLGTLTWFVGLIYGCLHLRRALWLFIGATSLVSAVFGWVVYALVKA